VLKFILVAGIAVPAVIDTAILALHHAAGWSDQLWTTSWWQWMIAGFFPTITIPPLLVLAARGGLTGRSPVVPLLQSEIALVVPALFVVSLVAFGGIIDAGKWPAVYLIPLPLLLWATARFGVGGTSLALLAMALGIATQALRQTGPFATNSLVDEVASLHAFLAVTSAPLLLFAALMDERRRTADLLRRFGAAIQVAASSTDTGLWQWDALAPRLWLTANCRAMFALPEEDTNTPYDFLEVVHPEDKAVVGQALERALTAGEQPPVLEFRLCSGGKTRWFVLQSRTACDDAGRPTSVSGVFRDISERIEGRLAVERLEERLASLQDDERRRIAQELHDSTAQHLVAAKLSLLSVRKRVSEEVQQLVDEAYHSLREATAEIRTFTYLLHASHVDEEGLCAMLKRYVPGFERRTGVRTALRVTERADELPGELQHALLRIAQESLGNTQRHAGATRATIDLRCIGEAVHLVVCDDGKGMCPEERERLSERLRVGLGIPGMTLRVRSSHGRNCGDCHGGGTAIHVAVPLQAQVPAKARGIANIAREALGAGRG
jgi:signal transduction histidine kinase